MSTRRHDCVSDYAGLQGTANPAGLNDFVDCKLDCSKHHKTDSTKNPPGMGSVAQDCTQSQNVPRVLVSIDLPDQTNALRQSARYKSIKSARAAKRHAITESQQSLSGGILTGRVTDHRRLRHYALPVAYRKITNLEQMSKITIKKTTRKDNRFRPYDLKLMNIGKDWKLLSRRPFHL